MEPEAGPSSAAVSSACFACGEPVRPEDQFCENCGVNLAAGPEAYAADDLNATVVLTRRSTSRAAEQAEAAQAQAAAEQPAAAAVPAGPAGPACPDCGGTGFTDGYCDTCGRLAPDPRDHIEQDLGVVAGVTDRGLRHSRNEDAMALAVLDGPEFPRPASVIVSCDGVSTSREPQVASLLAAGVIRDALAEALAKGEPAEPAMVAAMAAAQVAVAGLAEDPSEPANSSCCTAVAAVVEPGLVTVGSVGDSRVYWLSRTTADSRRLTLDDSWAGLMIAQGILSEAEAFRSPQAHTIVRWLGADAPDEPAHVTQFVPEGPGLILACSDGLWNYVPEADRLAELAVPTENGAWGGLQAAANSLCAVALESGGHDNITVTLAAYPPVSAQASALAETIQVDRPGTPGEDGQGYHAK
ncbi:MAG TPA: protein phosphatase 2C domain-containing protein [Actinocrinis sp.]|nr:protein phosphatase 2C domain-containing protein [Actinocrinis sp.]